MATLEGLKTMFEALLPEGVTYPPSGPTWFERFGTTPKETAQKLCAKWKLTEEQEVDFWYVWENHPTKLARSFQQGDQQEAVPITQNLGILIDKLDQTNNGIKLIMDTLTVQKKTYEGSKIPSEVRKKHFYYNQLPSLDSKLPMLRKFPPNSTGNNVSNQIRLYLSEYFDTIKTNFAAGNCSEKEFVQPPTNRLLMKFLPLLTMGEWVSEHEYFAELEKVEVSGKTDHALCFGNVSISTVEDKAIKVPLSPGHIGQALSQMHGAIRCLETLEVPYAPEMVVGILQNGYDWCFLYYFPRRKNGTKTAQCYHVGSLETDLDTITLFVEDALVNANKILHELNAPRVSTVPTLASIEEEEDFADDDSSDHSDTFNVKALQTHLPPAPSRVLAVPSKSATTTEKNSSKTNQSKNSNDTNRRQNALQCENTQNYLNAEALNSLGVKQFKCMI